MAAKGHCLYSHAASPIPFGRYPRTQAALTALADSDENLLYHATEVLSALTLAEMDSTSGAPTIGAPAPSSQDAQDIDA